MNRSETKSSPPADPDARRAHREERRTEGMHTDEHPEWIRLADAIRRQIAACVEMDTDRDTLASLAEDAESLADALEANADGKRVNLVGPGRGEDEFVYDLPFSPIMGRLNPASFGLDILHAPDGKGVFCVVQLSEVAEGGSGLVHGGVIAAIYDEVLAAANTVRQVGGPTASLTIRYRRPTPIYDPLRFEAWVDRIGERRIFTHGRCLVGDAVVSEAEAAFAKLDLGQTGIAWHKRRAREAGEG